MFIVLVLYILITAIPAFIAFVMMLASLFGKLTVTFYIGNEKIKIPASPKAHLIGFVLALAVLLIWLFILSLLV